MQPVTSPWAKIALVLFGIASGLVAVEIVLRVTMPDLGFQFPSFRITDDRFDRRRGARYADRGVDYTFDADGFRTDDKELPGDGRALLFVGDSFTEGIRVAAPATFTALACAELARHGFHRRCLNAGVSGFGTSHELRLLDRLLRRPDLTIDAVVLQVLPNNDFRDNWEDGGFEIVGGALRACDPPCIPAAVRWRDALFDNERARSLRVVTLAANAWFNGTGMAPNYDATDFALERRLLEEMVAITRRRDVPLVILVAATSWELDRETLHPFDERARLDFVVDVVRSLNVPWIDSRRIVSELDDYVADDGHFSAAGHARIAVALATELRRVLEQ